MHARLSRLRDDRPDTARDAGESLVELLMAVTIMAIAVAAVVGAFVTFVVVSGTHRSQTTAGAGVRNYAELLVTFAAGSGYAACGSPSAYSPAAVGYSTPSGYTASTTAIAYWTGSGWSTSCGTDVGLQRVTVTVASSDGRAAESAVVVLRRACSRGAACSA